MRAKFDTEMKDNQILVIVAKNSDYAESVADIMSAADRLYEKICYVSLNKPYKTVYKSLEEHGIDMGKIVFIDSVSGIAKRADDSTIFVSSPKALTELSMAITDVVGKGAESFLVDSLSTLLIYDESSTVIKFAHALISKARMHDTHFVFTILKEDVKTELLKDLGMFVDKIVVKN